MGNAVGFLFGLLNSVSMTPAKGAMGKAGELVAAVEGMLPERWRSRKLYVSMAVVLLVLLTDVDGTRKGLVGLLGGAGLFVVPEAIKDIVAAWRGTADGAVFATKTSTSTRMR